MLRLAPFSRCCAARNGGSGMVEPEVVQIHDSCGAGVVEQWLQGSFDLYLGGARITIAWSNDVTIGFGHARSTFFFPFELLAGGNAWTLQGIRGVVLLPLFLRFHSQLSPPWDFAHFEYSPTLTTSLCNTTHLCTVFLFDIMIAQKLFATAILLAGLVAAQDTTSGAAPPTPSIDVSPCITDCLGQSAGVAGCDV